MPSILVSLPDNVWFEYATKTFKLSDIFLNLIKLLVAPLILSTIVVGIAHMGDSSALGRIGFRAISWFIIASFISIGLGLMMVNLFQPGVGAPVDTGCRRTEYRRGEEARFLGVHPVDLPQKRLRSDGDQQYPADSGFLAIRRRRIVGAWRERRLLVRGADALAEMMLQITHYVMRFAPFAVFGALAKVAAASGLAILGTYFELVVEFIRRFRSCG